MPLTIERLPILSDNYAWLLRDEASGMLAVVDPADARAVIAAVDARGHKLDLILLTHHHDDHVAGTEQVRQRYHCPVVGGEADRHRLPELDRGVSEGDVVTLGESRAVVIDTPGHTVGHLAFHFADSAVLLAGDTLFSLGCGRVLEGTMDQMYASLRKLAALPPDTVVLCGHEYTQSNARFALHVDPDNAALRRRAAEVDRQRAAGEATVPTLLGAELAENPFLRAADAGSFAALRRKKDTFR
jgi:hydroxyacylglutathione hydrolase